VEEIMLNYLLYGIAGIGAIGYGGWSIYKNGVWKTLEQSKPMVFHLMEHAEKELSNGDDKFSYVVDGIYKLLPSYVKKLVRKKDIQKWVQNVYDEFCHMLD